MKLHKEVRNIYFGNGVEKMHKKVAFTVACQCGIPTALINATILYFTLPKMESIISSSLSINFLSVALGCGLICPLFGKMILKGIASKSPLENNKKNGIFNKSLPTTLFLGTVFICLITFVFLWLLPYMVVCLINWQFDLARIVWLIFIALYSGIAASFASYWGVMLANKISGKTANV